MFSAVGTFFLSRFPLFAEYAVPNLTESGSPQLCPIKTLSKEFAKSSRIPKAMVTIF
jgi:hypothetical protein